MDNPSIKFIENIRQQGAYFNVQELFFGKATSASPLKVKFKNIIVEEKSFAKTQSFIDLEKAYKHYGKTFIKTGDVLLIAYLKEIDKYIIVDKVVM